MSLLEIVVYLIILGTWIARQFHLPALLAVHIGGRRFPIVWSIVGAVILVAVADVIMRPRYLRRSAA